MIDLARYLPALLLAGGAGVAAKGGGDVSRKLIDTVKVVVTRFEMGAVAQAIEIEIDATMGGSVPSDGAKLEAYIKENVSSRTGRDPSMDLWGKPYHIAKIGGKLTLFSFGPNGQRDRCHDQTVDEQVKGFKDAVDEERNKAMEAAEGQAQALKAIVEAGDDLDLDELTAKVAEPVAVERTTSSLRSGSAAGGGADDVCVYLALEARGKGGGGADMYGGQSPYKQIKH